MPTDKITVLIADDEQGSRNRLRTLLGEDSRFVIVSEAVNGDQVVTEIVNKSPKVAFLDINMPGTSIFNTIPTFKNPPIIIFQTAYNEYAVKAFDIEALDYLLKPFSRKRFKRTLDKVISTLTISSDNKNSFAIKEESISVKSGDIIKVLKCNNISRISFKDGFSFIHYMDDIIFTEKPLSYYEDRLKSMDFYRISRTEIVNIRNLTDIDNSVNGRFFIQLNYGNKIKVSRRRVQGLKELLKL